MEPYECEAGIFDVPQGRRRWLALLMRVSNSNRQAKRQRIHQLDQARDAGKSDAAYEARPQSYCRIVPVPSIRKADRHHQAAA